MKEIFVFIYLTISFMSCFIFITGKTAYQSSNYFVNINYDNKSSNRAVNFEFAGSAKNARKVKAAEWSDLLTSINWDNLDVSTDVMKAKVLRDHVHYYLMSSTAEQPDSGGRSSNLNVWLVLLIAALAAAILC